MGARNRAAAIPATEAHLIASTCIRYRASFPPRCLLRSNFVLDRPFPRVAGFLGTILRNNLRMVFDPTASFSWNALMIEVGAGLLLGFALALLYLVGSLA